MKPTMKIFSTDPTKFTEVDICQQFGSKKVKIHKTICYNQGKDWRYF